MRRGGPQGEPPPAPNSAAAKQAEIMSSVTRRPDPPPGVLDLGNGEVMCGGTAAAMLAAAAWLARAYPDGPHGDRTGPRAGPILNMAADDAEDDTRREVQDHRNGTRPASERKLVLTAASTIRPKAVRWIDGGRIPVGMITLLAGREGIGKSTISGDLAADITRGTLPGEYYGVPRGVGICAAEDDWAMVIVPRLIAAGADMTRVYRIEAIEEGTADSISVPGDLLALAAQCAEHDIVLLIIDPVMSVIPSGVDTHKDREVRRVLEPLKRFAGETGISVLALIHVNKSGSTDALNSVMASKAFTAVARSVLFGVADPDSEDDGFLLGHPKCNVGPKQKSVAYRIGGCKVETTGDDGQPGRPIPTSRVIWGEADDRTITDVLGSQQQPAGRPVGQLASRIIEWVTGQERTVSTGDLVAAFADVKRSTLDTNLKRMVDRGALARPAQGLYALPSPDLSPDLSPSPTPPITKEVRETKDDLSLLPLLSPEDVRDRVKDEVKDAPVIARSLTGLPDPTPEQIEHGRQTGAEVARSVGLGTADGLWPKSEGEMYVPSPSPSIERDEAPHPPVHLTLTFDAQEPVREPARLADGHTPGCDRQHNRYGTANGTQCRTATASTQ